MKEYIFDGAFVSLMRKRHGMTLEALAKKLGTSKGYVWELENKQRSNPSFSVVAALADILEVPMKAFIRRSDTEGQTNTQNANRRLRSASPRCRRLGMKWLRILMT